MTVANQIKRVRIVDAYGQPFEVALKCAMCGLEDPSGFAPNAERECIYCLPCAAKRYWRGEHRYFAAAAVVNWDKFR